jgi:hypothetical protein
MKEIYRVRYKRGDVEIDIESSDKDYIDNKLAEVQSFTPSVANETVKSRGRRKKSSPQGAQSGHADHVSDSVLAQIIASINDAENYDEIAKKVLDRSDRTARILLCYYFAERHPTKPALTTTDVERITSQLGVKIAQPNVAKVIRQGAGKYLTADRVRRKGIPVLYQINRRGIAAFERVVAGGKLAE